MRISNETWHTNFNRSASAHRSRTAYSANPFDVAQWGYLQNLQCDPLTMVLNRSHVHVLAAIPWGLRSVITERNYELFWEQGSTPTSLVKRAHALPADLRCEATNMLVDGVQNFQQELEVKIHGGLLCRQGQ